jgi:AAA ATPase domain
MAHQSIAQQKQILEEIKSISRDPLQSQQEVTGSHTDADGFASPLFDFLTSKVEPLSRKDNKSQLKTELIAAIHEDVEDYDDDLVTEQRLPSVTAGRARSLQNWILRSLSYDGMDNREERIAEAYGETFKWVFEDSSKDQRKWSNFKDWLISDSQLYWVTGKPGSGKSTLMKYICYPEEGDDQAKAKAPSRCTKFLREWARNCHLIIGSFFFWNSGMPLQMQQEGLLRTLLVQILGQIPHLIQTATPRRWEALCLINEDPLDWSNKELQQMLRLAIKNLAEDEKLCLFVDGLDEFDGDHGALVSLFKELVQNPSVKLCVSSRPWLVFEDAFQHTPSLRLQDLTYSDIKLYVSSHMDKDLGFELLSKREPAYASELVENIVEKASGVFLWVRLAVFSIVNGMGHGDRISDLQKRLDALPTELEELYDRILLSLDPFYLEHTAHLFKFVQQSIVPPSVQLLAFADDVDCWRTAIEREVQPISSEEADVLQETMRRRINSRCKGFLEIDKGQKLPIAQKSPEPVTEEPVDWDPCTVQYLHRTVKDYIESPPVQQKFQSAMKSPYDLSLKQCAGTLSLIKSRPLETLPLDADVRFWNQVDKFLRHAARILPENLPQMLKLVDELDRTCAIIAKRNAGREFPSSPIYKWRQEVDYLELGQWVAAYPSEEYWGYTRTHILSLAVRYGITGYIENRVNHRCLVQMHGLTSKTQTANKQLLGQNPKDENPLLLCMGFLHPLLLDAVTFRRDLTSAPCPEMVLCLLMKGADPNYPVERIDFVDCTPTTVWGCVICLASSKRTEDKLIPAWPETYKLMLEHGAGQFPDSERQELLTKLDLILKLEKSTDYRDLIWNSMLSEVKSREIPKSSWLGLQPLFNWRRSNVTAGRQWSRGDMAEGLNLLI